MAGNKLTPGDTINCVGWDWVVLDADDEKALVLAKKQCCAHLLTKTAAMILQTAPCLPECKDKR